MSVLEPCALTSHTHTPYCAQSTCTLAHQLYTHTHTHTRKHTHTHIHTHTRKHTLGAEYSITSDGFFELEDLPKYTYHVIFVLDHIHYPISLPSAPSPTLIFLFLPSLSTPLLPSLSPPTLSLPSSPPPSHSPGKQWWLEVGTLLWS